MSMEELKAGPLKKPLDKSNLGHDVAALNGLLTMINNPALTGAEVPKGEDVRVVTTPPATAPVFTPEVELPSPEFIAEPAPPAVVKSNRDRIVFTGRIGVGKDYCAKQSGATIYGFADPLYYLAKFFFGMDVTASQNKDIPGMREFLQLVGQWGRGTINEKYPIHPARAMFISAIRSLHSVKKIDGFAVDWATYGTNEDIWLDACLRRANLASGRLAITNVRFLNEFKRVQSEGWRHWHVMTDKNTWIERLKTKGLAPESPEVRDITEKLAASLDQDVIKKISNRKAGPKLRVIWNSPASPPSNRIFTLNEFLQEAAIDAVPLPAELTGE